jgi:hypothetical protein
MKSPFIWIWTHVHIYFEAAAIVETLTGCESVPGAAPPYLAQWAVYQVELHRGASNQMGEGNVNIVYELGRLHLAPPGELIGGAVQSYYEQGYNNQDYQYQPPAED